jgi:FkbM family methyltransferase
MSLLNFLSQPVKRIIHIGSAAGSEEIPLYDSLNIDEVVWIDANPMLIERLRKRLEEVQPKFKSYIFESVITDKVGELTDFHLYYANDNYGMSSIFEKVSGSDGKEDYEFNRQFHEGTLQLESNTIDNLLETNNIDFNFDLINIDVQGAELVVLSGAKKTLESSKSINSEVTFRNHDYSGGVYFDELSKYLSLFGYNYVGNTSVSGDGSYGDSFYTK